MTIPLTQPWPPGPDAVNAVAPAIDHLLAPNASSWTYEGTNSYVIGHGAESVIVDPGVQDPGHLESLRRAGHVDGGRVTAVLLTHDHPDHSDGARELADSLDVPIRCVSPRFADAPLHEGEVLAVDGLEVRVLHTPGHSDDSVCLWLPASGALLTGDTLLGARSAGVMGDLGDLLTSLERLREFAEHRDLTALPGHGPAFTDLVASASRVIDVRTRRINEVRTHIAAGNTTLLALIGRLYPDLTGSRAMFGASTVISTVEYLARLEPDRGIADAGHREQILADIQKQQRLMAEARKRAADDSLPTREDH